MPDGDPTKTMPRETTWWVYIVRCADNTLYTGITTDLTRRIQQHNGDRDAGARYTRSRRPVKLVYREPTDSRASASRREIAIKAMPRKHKQALCAAFDGLKSLPAAASG